MEDKDLQNEYEGQTDEELTGIMQTDTAKTCCKCCCSYIKGTMKAFCKIVECLVHP